MKKILHKIIGFILILGCLNVFCCISYADDTSITDKLKNTIDVLRLFNIIPDYYDYNIAVRENITRADFASAAAKLIGTEKYDSGETYYYDVPKTHWAYKEIGALTEMGILHGSDDRIFRPDAAISLNEAYKILLTAMKYEPYAEADGGYPAGYIKLAAKLDFAVPEYGGSDELCRGDALLLLRSAMTANILEIGSYVGNTVEYVESEETLLSANRRIYYDKGVLNGADGISVNDTVTLDSDSVIIDNEIYDSDIRISEYIAEKIEFFYSCDKATEEKKILWAKPVGTTDLKYVTADNDASFNPSDFVLTYRNEAGNSRTIRLSRQLTVIYNGGIADKDFDKIFNKQRYTAKFVMSDGEYKVAVVKAYETFVVGSADKKNLTVYDKAAPTDKLVLDESKYDRMTIKFMGASDISFDDIKSGFVLNYYLSLDKKNLEVLVTAEKINGTVERYGKTDGGYNVVIGGIEYFMPESSANTALTAAAQVTAYLDTFGDIAYIETADSGYHAAYMINAFLSEGEDELHFKLLNESGVIEKNAECADRIVIDGIRYKNHTEAYKTFFEAGSFVQQLVLISRDSDNRIYKIDTVGYNPKNENQNSLSINIPYAEDLHFRKMGILGEKSVINNNTKIFSVPSEGNYSDDKQYVVLTANDINEDAKLNAETYKAAEQTGYEQYVVIKGYDVSAKLSADAPLLVTNIKTALNNDDAVVKRIEGYSGSQAVSFLADEGTDFNDVLPGMVIRLKKDMEGYVSGYETKYDYRNPELYKRTSSINDGYYIGFGYVNNVVDGVVKYGYDSGAAIDRVYFPQDAPVLIYDTEESKDNVKIGSINDAITYYNSGDSCSKIFVYSSYSYPRMFVIYI